MDNKLCEDYWRTVEEYKPWRAIFNLAAARTMEFDNKMHEIKPELDWIAIILKHVRPI